MNWLKYVIGLLIVIALCTAVWFIRPTNAQLEAKISVLEEQIGRHYLNDFDSLERTAEQLLEYDLNLPITEENGKVIDVLSRDLDTILNNLFYNHPLIYSEESTTIHSKWHNELSQAKWNLPFYGKELPLTKDEAADLYQILQASRFIAKDFRDIVGYDYQSAYDAMHDKDHEMVERINYRLSIKY
ncbi:hypothetical protein [Solibacillus sp. FSL W8-0372]|uniref:hypothetical protein n=1 Tax=Solibacillus sp. FSL W8-0372 TaxID=2921713 RepID=UPI0030D28D8D